MTMTDIYQGGRKITIYRGVKIAMDIDLEECFSRVKEHLGFDSDADVFRYLIKDYFTKEIERESRKVI
jgi:hypothetical protein